MKYTKKSFLILSTLQILLISNQQTQAHDGDHDSNWVGSRPDAHAPITVMGDHTHAQGEFMFSYRYMYMEMDGMRSGTDRLSSADVFAQNFTVTPERMSMEMHMFGLMYAASDKLTLMAMLPYKSIEMDHRIFSGAAPLIALNQGRDTFTTKTEGFGDFKLTGLYRVLDQKGRRAHIGLGLSLPTGSIGERDRVPGPGGLIDRQLPLPMQLGSGTVDFLPSFTYFVQKEKWSYGDRVSATFRLEENHHNYQLGDEFMNEFWIARKVNDWVSFSAKLNYKYQEEIEGTQSDLLFNPPFAPTRRTVTTAFSENYGGHTVGVGLGTNILIPTGKLKGNRFAFEVSMPVYQDLNGVQLETDYVITAGWQLAW